MSSQPLYLKDVNAVLDWEFDWSDWLTGAETISSRTVTVQTGLTKDSDTASTTAVLVWLSGGTAGSTYTVACRIVTSASRTDERTIRISVRER